MMLSGGDLFVIIIVFLAILTLFLGVKTVPQGYAWTVERFGRYTRSPGSISSSPSLTASAARST